MGQKANNMIIQFSMHLPAKVVKKRNIYVSFCPALDVATQGDTEEEAKRNLIEALSAFVLSCLERGTLEEVLKECGFTPLQGTFVKPKSYRNVDYVDVPIPLIASRESRCHA
jgi:predicted RNase H-like HicB family nuclease